MIFFKILSLFCSKNCQIRKKINSLKFRRSRIKNALQLSFLQPWEVSLCKFSSKIVKEWRRSSDFRLFFQKRTKIQCFDKDFWIFAFFCKKKFNSIQKFKIPLWSSFFDYWEVPLCKFSSKMAKQWMRSSDLKVIFFKKGPKIQCFDQDF